MKHTVYERHSIYPVATILPLIGLGGVFNTGQIKVSLRFRLRLFWHKGTVCVSCGIEGTQFAIERHWGVLKWHMNLYCDSGRMMTVDHIIPKSKGGRRILSNLQPMCSHCNGRKGDKLFTAID